MTGCGCGAESARLADLPTWVRELAEQRRFGDDDRRGTANLIDDAARSRGAAHVSSGSTISLARPLRAGDFTADAEHPGFLHDTWYVPVGDGTGWGFDHLVLNAHGLQNTHLDALNHVAVDDTYYGGRPVAGSGHASVEAIAPDGIFTRAVHVDIPFARGTAWAETPVEADDIDAALAAAGIRVEPGDALLLDMGRDRFEAARGHMLGQAGTPTHSGGGLSSSGAAWVADHAISVLAWDMLDAHEAKAAHASAHVLTWAIGLLLVDNCDYGALRRALGDGTKVAGALVLSTLVVEGANGVNCNPLVLR